MKRVVLALALILAPCLMVSNSYGETVSVAVEGDVKDSHKNHSHTRTVLSEGEVTVHDKTVDSSYRKNNEQGVGADILLYDTTDFDLVGEYKYDWANGGHSAYTVVKTKKSLWTLVKGVFGK